MAAITAALQRQSPLALVQYKCLPLSTRLGIVDGGVAGKFKDLRLVELEVQT